MPSAATIFTELTDVQKRQLVDDHTSVLACRNSHAAALRSLGALSESESEYRSLLDAATASHGEQHTVTLIAHFEWAMSLIG
ncbi:hypothetical protein ACWGI8_21545 [Streptomyces sp. NPDC054841]